MLRLAWTALRRRSTPPHPVSRQTPTSPNLLAPAADETFADDTVANEPSANGAPGGIETTSTNHLRIPSVSRTHPRPRATASHRDRVLAMRICHSRLCSEQRALRLEALGVYTLGDIALGDVPAIAEQFANMPRALRQLKRYRRAIRLAASVPTLAPADALVLISIHRPHPISLASQSPATLRRDLIRFADSTDGQLALRGRRIPSLRRIKGWIEGATQVAAA